MFKIETGISVQRIDGGHWVCRRITRLGQAPEVVRLSGPYAEPEAERIAREMVVSEADAAREEASLRAAKGRGKGGKRKASPAQAKAIGMTLNPRMGDDDGD